MKFDAKRRSFARYAGPRTTRWPDFAESFSFPKGADGGQALYFAGNSLGLQPRKARAVHRRRSSTTGPRSASRGIFMRAIPGCRTTSI